MSTELRLIACVPVELAAIHAPSYLEIAKKNDNSDFDSVACPRCGSQMWLGKRSRTLVEQGTEMLCMLCLAERLYSTMTRDEAIATLIPQLQMLERHGKRRK